MTLYYTIFTLLGITTLFELSSNKKLKLDILKVWCVFFAIFGGIRWYTGGDFDQGIEIFETVNWSNVIGFQQAFHVAIVEPLYCLLHLLVKITLGEYVFVMLFICTLSQYSYYVFCKRFSFNHPILLYVLLMIGMRSLFPVRAGLAMSLILLAYTYLADNRNKAFFVTILLAINIHQMSIVMLPVYFLKKIKYRLVWWHAAILFLFFVVIGKIFQSYFVSIALLFGGTIADKVDSYSNFETVSSTGGVPIFTILFNGICLGLFFKLRSAMHLQRDATYNTMLILSLAAICIRNVFHDGMSDLMRLADPFNPILTLLIVWIFSFYMDKYKYKFFVLLIFCFYVYTKVNQTLTEAFEDACVPYQTVFDI